MNILFLGDIVGKIGRNAVRSVLPILKKEYSIDFVIANGENATHGKGLNESHYHFLLDSGIDVITLGNHYNSQKQSYTFIGYEERLIRPCNLIDVYPGKGTNVFECKGKKIRVTNVLGNSYIELNTSSSYQSLKEIVDSANEDIHIVDIHGESTGEKQALAYAFDGKISAILGTHTHVQTNDEKILPNGTAFMADVGMCGDYDGVLGFESKSVINKTLYGGTERFTIKDKGNFIVNGAVLKIGDDGKCIEITKVRIEKNGKN